MLTISEGIGTCLSDSAIGRSARSAGPEWREVVDRDVFFLRMRVAVVELSTWKRAQVSDKLPSRDASASR
jgi:hypothetical protein